MLGWFRRWREGRRERRRLEARVVNYLVAKKGLQVHEARRLAPLVVRGEITPDDAVVLAGRLRRERLRRVGERLGRSGGRFEGLAGGLDALTRDMLSGFGVGGAGNGAKKEGKSRKRRKAGDWWEEFF